MKQLGCQFYQLAFIVMIIMQLGFSSVLEAYERLPSASEVESMRSKVSELDSFERESTDEAKVLPMVSVVPEAPSEQGSNAELTLDGAPNGEREITILNKKECEIPKAPPKITDDIGYLIWPGDSLQIFVWQNPELSMSVVVRPDGRISIPLVEELDVAGKAPATVARAIETMLLSYIKSPLVTVIISGLSGSSHQSIRVLGSAVTPKEMRYYKGVTVLDLVVALGGLSEYAAGNKAELVRDVCGSRIKYPLRLDDLAKGDIDENVDLLPGDVVVIPESFF